MSRLQKPLIDTAFLTILVLVISWFVRSTDPGWFKIQFSAWLIVPVLVGGRHGFKAGVMAAVVAALVGTFVQQLFTGAEARHLLSDYPAYYVGLLLVGALSGLSHRMKVNHLMGIEDEVQELKAEREELQSLNQLYRENEQLMERALAQNKVTVQSMTKDAEKIAKNSVNIPDDLLSLLTDHFGVRGAGMYKATSDGAHFSRQAATGNSKAELPSQFSFESSPEMIKAALDSGEITTCRTLWDVDEKDPSSSQPFLAVLPAGDHLLLIQDMAFESINWDTFARVDSVFKYVTSSRQPKSQTSAEATEIPQDAVVAR